MKKEVIAALFLVLSIALPIKVLAADELGCCTNPGATTLTCSPDRLVFKDMECCPRPESTFPSYYKSAQNIFLPTNYNDCIANFFYSQTACSLVNACSLGCCCSDLGGEIKPNAQCKGTGLTFYNGQTNCNALCPKPQCNDAIDNDNNGCADFPVDTGCTSPADTTESLGSCIQAGANCNDQNYVPKLSNLEITPAKGGKKFSLRWSDECSQNAISYDIFRCKNVGCSNLELVGTASANSFDDASGDLLFETIYTYQVKARYNLQTSRPFINKTASLGNLECFGQYDSNYFCISESYYTKYKDYLITNFPAEFSGDFSAAVRAKFGNRFNGAYFCDSFNKLNPRGSRCSSTQVCIVTNNQPSCIVKSDCNYLSANPFGLYYNQQDCENGKYCFYDRSHSTVNSCFGCDPSMACYDYKTEDACARDNCKIGNCQWKNLANQIGVGVCVKKNEYNCEWCDKKGTATLENLRAFNEVFDFCTIDKSNALSEGSFKCYANNHQSKNCNDIVCTDYGTSQCSDVGIIHDEFNKITNPSQDACGLKVCQKINNQCIKNADGDVQADCDTALCESDYSAPNTTFAPIVNGGVYNSLLIQIYDRTSVKSPITLRTSNDYITYLCVEPCGQNGHPYNTSTTGRSIIISNLNAYDGTSGNKLLTFNEGANVIRYYSQDPAKNIGEVNKIIIQTHSNTNGPKVLEPFNITDGSKIGDKYYTSNQMPRIDIQFLEPALVTLSRLRGAKTGKIMQLQGSTDLSTRVTLTMPEILQNDEYVFDLNAKNQNNIFMNPPLSTRIVIDNTKPVLDITPSNKTILNNSLVNIRLSFDKEVNIELVEINSQSIKDSFSTIDNKVYTATVNLSDGNKNIKASASDFSKNKVTGYGFFIVDASPTVISLAKPRFGTASTFVFDLAVETDNDAICRYSLDSVFEFDFMEPFAASSGTLHSVSNFNKIATNDFRVHKFYVRCKNDKYGIVFKSFDLSVDNSIPQLKNTFASPNPVVERPMTTSLKIESDEPVICKYSKASREFNSMEGKFDGYDSNNFRTINKQEITLDSEGRYLYYVACMNKAELVSNTAEIQINVDLSIPLSITSHTTEFWNSTNVVLAIETNKISQCQYSESDTTAQNGDIFGAPGYAHTRNLILPAGKHTFYVICKDQYLQKFSDVASVTFTIDTTPPVVLYVNDSSTLPDKPEFTWHTDELRVKWNSVDTESRIALNSYALIDSGTTNTILNWTTSYENDKWVTATKNGKSLNLTNGNKYYFKVKAQNFVGSWSDIKESDGVTVDTNLKPLNCTNGIKDEKETDIDCGMVCSKCDLGKNCNEYTDCTSNFCSNGKCTAPKCDDNLKNGQESDVDCGGICTKCDNNKACNNNNDCSTSFCSFGFCKPQETCSNGNHDGTETGIDCGGACPTKCEEGGNCGADEDCVSGLSCVLSQCKKCADNDKNCNGIPDDQETAEEKDTDGDGMPDKWEIEHDLDSNDPSDKDSDTDNDGLTNYEEYKYKTNPNLNDTDGDGYNDGDEVKAGTNPIDSEDFPKSNLGKIMSFVFVAILLILGFGYLTYSFMTKRKAEKFEVPRQRELQRMTQLPQVKQAPSGQRMEGVQIRQAFKKKEEQKEKEREKLFEAFGKEEKEQKFREVERKKPKPEETEEKLKPEIKEYREKTKMSSKKPREDVFVKLKQITKEEKRKKSSKK